MSETIQGTLEEIAIAGTGKGKRGPWTLRKITVDGVKYSTFDPVKATIGSTVEFESQENDKGYLDVVKGSFQVIEEATPEKSAKTSQKTAERTTNTNQSIENQVALKTAVEFSGGFDLDPDAGLALVIKAYRSFTGLLHPTGAGETAKPVAKKTAARKQPEDESQDPGDETPDY